MPEAQAARPAQIKVALAAPHSLCHLPLLLADRLGYLQASGLMLDWQACDSGAQARGLVQEGRADVLAGAFEHVLHPSAQGALLQAFALMTRTPMVSLGLSTRRAALQMPMGLKGARIGISSLHSSTHWMTSQWLLRNGLLPEDVQFVEVGTSVAASQALREGTVDALCNPDPLMHGLELRNEVRLIGDARTQSAAAQLLGGSTPGACLMASEEFLDKHVAETQALVSALSMALRWLVTAGPTDLLRVVPMAAGMNDRAVYLGAFEKLRESYPLDAMIGEDAVLNAWRFHARVTGQLRERSWLGRTFTNAFVLRSRRRMG